MIVKYNDITKIESCFDDNDFCYMQNKRIGDKIIWTKIFKKLSDYSTDVKEDIVFCSYYKKNNIVKATSLQKELDKNDIYILIEETNKKVGNKLLTIKKTKYIDGRTRSKSINLFVNNKMIKFLHRFEGNKINTFAEAINVDKQSFKIYRFHKNSKLYSFRIRTKENRFLRHGNDVNSNKCAFYWNNDVVNRSIELL